MNKKLQVFVSSTYTDLKEERQAAVEAILDAGHIPAGMELFKAGNETQLKTIYKWIDESDVYMLILGGRYGSIEEKTGKSYTQLEYEYALSRDIPVFAVVLSDSFTTKKITSLGLKNVIEQNNPDKYKTFKSLVMTKIIREADDCKDIKLVIHSTLNDFLNKYNLIGWVRNSNENDIVQLLKDKNNLSQKNDSLTKQIEELQKQLQTKKEFGNYTFQELYDILKNKKFTDSQNQYTALDYFILFYEGKCYELDEDIYDYLNAYNLIETETITETYTEYKSPNSANDILAKQLYSPLFDTIIGHRATPSVYPTIKTEQETKQVKTNIGRLFYLYLGENK